MSSPSAYTLQPTMQNAPYAHNHFSPMPPLPQHELHQYQMPLSSESITTTTTTTQPQKNRLSRSFSYPDIRALAQQQAVAQDFDAAAATLVASLTPAQRLTLASAAVKDLTLPSIPSYILQDSPPASIHDASLDHINHVENVEEDVPDVKHEREFTFKMYQPEKSEFKPSNQVEQPTTAHRHAAPCLDYVFVDEKEKASDKSIVKIEHDAKIESPIITPSPEKKLLQNRRSGIWNIFGHHGGLKSDDRSTDKKDDNVMKMGNSSQDVLHDEMDTDADVDVKLEATESVYKCDQVHGSRGTCFQCVAGKLINRMKNTLKSKVKTEHIEPTSDISDSMKDKEKPYVCPVCNRGFVRKHDLKRHTVSHNDSTPLIKCQSCLKTFTRVDALHRHVKGNRCKGPSS